MVPTFGKAVFSYESISVICFGFLGPAWCVEVKLEQKKNVQGFDIF